MEPTLNPEAAAVVATFVAAYPPYVRSRLPDGSGGTEMERAIADGVTWLEAELTALLAIDYARQRRGPLELFQEATGFPTNALTRVGVAPSERGAVERTALPGDRYGLAPASSQDLGEAAWRAHVAWGVAKAAAIAGAAPAPSAAAGPRVAAVGGSISDRAMVEQAARRAGLLLVHWRNPAAVEKGLEAGVPVLTVIDLDHASAHEAIATVAAVAGRILAFGEAVDDLQQAAMLALGATEVVEESRLNVMLGRMLPTGV